MDLYAVVTKLIGPVRPIGKTEADDARFENLKVLCDLVDALHTDIDDVAQLLGRPEFSVNRAGEYADKFLTRMGILE